MKTVPGDLGRFFYRALLTEQGKQFYDCMVTQFERKEYAGHVPVKIRDQGSAAADAFAAYQAIRDDHPEYFFLGDRCEFVYQGHKGMLHCMILYSASIIERVQLQLRKTISRLLRGTAFQSPLECEKTVYERIAQKLTYEDHHDMRDHSIVGPLLTSSGVCEGYTALLMLCLRRLEIPCIKIYGKTKEDVWHCWCLVWMNEEAMHCDVTWDKPYNGVVQFRYFNLNDQMIAKDHFDFCIDALPNNMHQKMKICTHKFI